MRIAFVYPRFEKFLSENPELDSGLAEYFLGDFTTPPSLGIPILAALTPEDVETVLIDDNFGDKINYSAGYDLVAINCFTPQASRAFEISDGFRKHGTKVIMGGFFPSFMVDECLKHADSVNIGEGEPTWQKIINDTKNGTLKHVYKGGCRLDPGKIPIPKREIFYNREDYDWEEDLVQVTRGCLYNCAMCAIPAHMGHKMRFRPVENVVEEIRGLKYDNVYLADDSLFFPQRKIIEYSKILLKALIPLKKKYFVSSTVALNTDRELIDLMVKAGIKNFYCTMNVDPVSIRALQGGKNEQNRIIDLVSILKDNGVRFFGSCALGRDWDDTSIADRILELFYKADIRTSEFFIFSPYPGSVHWDRMKSQNRIIDFEWSHYNGAHVVFKPTRMSAEELYKQFIKVWNEFFRSQKKQHIAHLEPSTWEKGVEIVGKPLQGKGVRSEAVITGIGLLSPIGNTKEKVLEALWAGKHGIVPISKYNASCFYANYAGEIKGFEPSEHLSEYELSSFEDDYLRYAIISARAALKDAGIKVGKENPRDDIGVVLSTCNGGLLSGEEEYKWKHGKSDKPFSEKMNLQAQYYGFGKAIADALGIRGEIWLVTTACSSSTGAIGIAKMLIDRGYYSKVLVGGSDSFSLANLAGFDGLKATSCERIAPFSLPIGLNVGEASCFWVVEEMEKAILRNARCIARIAGHATTSDAYHPTAPDPRGDGVFRTLRNALSDSGYTLDDIGCINAHGTGTEANDRAESKGILKLIVDKNIPVVSTKSFFGHCMGCTGILEATCNLLAMNKGFIPPTLNFKEKRPGCNLDFVPNKPRKVEYDAFISSNYAFGGNNAAVVITKWDKKIPERKKKKNRVVITGKGSVSSLGIDMKSLMKGLYQEECGIGSAESVSQAGLTSLKAGIVKNFRDVDINRRLDFSGMSNKISKMASAASWHAFSNAGLRPDRRKAEDYGIVMGICNGPPEIEHMDRVFTTENHEADVSSFSNITANSVAGWVSNVLYIKGVNTTLSAGPHASMQALAYAFDFLTMGRAKCMLAGGADEIDKQTFFNYDLLNFLCRHEEENDYRLRFNNKREKVLGEGSAMLLLEDYEHAVSRGAHIIGEILGYGMSMDGGPFLEQNMDPDGLKRACLLALKRSEIAPDDIGLIVWAPQGNLQDKKVVDVCEKLFGEKIPMAATTFNTGYIESASIAMGLAAVLDSLDSNGTIWPQKTGVEFIDKRELKTKPENIMVCASSDVGYNYAVVVGNVK